MKKVKYILGVLALLALASCKETDYMEYNDGPKLQFGPAMEFIYKPAYNLADTTKAYTFYYDKADKKLDTVYFDIYALGGVSSKDRSFKLKQVEDRGVGVTNAVAGTHYVAFDDPAASKNFVIKAGQMHSKVPVILLRDPSLKNIDVVLKFSVLENENFKYGEIPNLWRKINLADRLSRPVAWSTSMAGSYYGAYSVVKHQFMIEVTKLKWDEAYMGTALSDLAQLNFYLGLIKVALIDYNKAHPGNPLKDEAGQLVVFP